MRQHSAIPERPNLSPKWYIWYLCMRKFCAIWVPQLFTIDQKRIRVTSSEKNLAYFNRNSRVFAPTYEDKWNMYPPLYSGITWKVKQWVKPGESAPKPPKTQSGKVMASVFWNAHGVIFIDYLEKGRTITGAYYAALLERLVDEIRKKRPHLKKKKSFFMITKHHLTHRTLHRQKSMNWVMNRFRIHRILQTWPPATIIYSQTSRDGCVVAFWVERRSWMGNRRVFWRVWQIVLFGRHRKVGRSLDSLYRTKRRVHWEIKPIFAKKVNSCSFYHVNIKHASNMVSFCIVKKPYSGINHILGRAHGCYIF